MIYVSTRGGAPPADFSTVLETALAPDGGLYTPSAWPQIEPAAIARLSGISYAEAAYRILRPFLGGMMPDDEFRALTESAYASFDDAAVAPLVETAPGEWLLELFHGPTLAFKDIAMQLLARLLERGAAARRGRLTIVGATSGDTGAAAVEAVRGRAGLDLVMLYPHGRISEMQRRQMTTHGADNVHVIAVEGTFDDCQAIVKAVLGDPELRRRTALTGVNSINWARVMAQAVYYFTAAARLGAPLRAPVFVVPTGNFGNVFAGYAAARMGLPVSRLVIATNENDILTRMVQTGRYVSGEVRQTLSPAMDIQKAGNFERLLFEICGRDGAAVAEMMNRFERSGALELRRDMREHVAASFAATRVDDGETMAAIRDVYRESGRLIDPHTGVAVAAARRIERPGGAPVVILATAHPAKFPEAVFRAAGVCAETPERLARLAARPERSERLPCDAAIVRRAIGRHIESARSRLHEVR